MVTPIQQQELSLDKNPGKTRSDSIPVAIRVWWKAKLFSGGHHHTIIPMTRNHTSWSLGAQPDLDAVKKISKEARTTPPNEDIKIHVVSMLHEDERVIKESEVKQLQRDGLLSEVDRNPWFDHGTLSVRTSKNQTPEGMQNSQEKFYSEFDSIPPKTVFYCHCMAGKSRSFVETASFLYFYPDKKKLFDFENWPKGMVEKIDKKAPGLRSRLLDNPSLSDLAEFVKIQRPDVKEILKMDGDQAGFLGLMSLHKWANDLKKDPDIIANRDKVRAYRDAQNIGLMLKAPLDSSFRDPKDRIEQDGNLAAVYQAYQKRGINLLMTMVVPINEQIKMPVSPSDYTEAKFEKRFRKMSVREQVRFAILLQKLEQHQPSLDLGPLRGRSLHYANIAAEKTKKVKEMTAGDQVEFLRVFGTQPGLNYESVAAKILKGERLDGHNSIVQLKVLQQMAQAKGYNKTALLDQALLEALSRVSKEEGDRQLETANIANEIVSKML